MYSVAVYESRPLNESSDMLFIYLLDIIKHFMYDAIDICSMIYKRININDKYNIYYTNTRMCNMYIYPRMRLYESDD